MNGLHRFRQGRMTIAEPTVLWLIDGNNETALEGRKNPASTQDALSSLARLISISREQPSDDSLGLFSGVPDGTYARCCLRNVQIILDGKNVHMHVFSVEWDDPSCDGILR